jgi:hypothetical protein
VLFLCRGGPRGGRTCRACGAGRDAVVSRFVGVTVHADADADADADANDVYGIGR